ncbi:hypothetical protein H9L19_02195 [Weissella diestrammenae]|uniref:Uncharacterized protein n=1 Tax=Weissella diestrammenae TaxID=1162633 RepID=A0A7G9T6H6_9LACO|nr:hypothetical protein [Weissella diestrammenae]MCM0583244.1 hypothetical protein [Weissella diestrammenae]QNN75701.1 hypothetical protein H9L19_02195 [Weissella diestrammenae]
MQKWLFSLATVVSFGLLSGLASADEMNQQTSFSTANQTMYQAENDDNPQIHPENDKTVISTQTSASEIEDSTVESDAVSNPETAGQVNDSKNVVDLENSASSAETESPETSDVKIGTPVVDESDVLNHQVVQTTSEAKAPVKSDDTQSQTSDDRLSDYIFEHHQGDQTVSENDETTSRSDVLEIAADDGQSQVNGQVINKNQVSPQINVTTPLGPEEKQSENTNIVDESQEGTKIKHAGVGNLSITMQKSVWLPVVAAWVIVALFIWAASFYGISRLQAFKIQRMTQRAETIRNDS